MMAKAPTLHRRLKSRLTDAIIKVLPRSKVILSDADKVNI